MTFSIRNKINIVVIGLVLISTLLVAVVYFNKISSLLTDNALAQLGEEVAYESKRLTSKTDKLRKDLLYLASMPSVEAFASSLSPRALNNIQTSIVNMLKVEPDYLQIRYLDNKGHERIRVERDQERIITTAAHLLQDKSGSEYYRETARLKSGQVYFSNINLNREYGKIMRPYTPVLRAATPVYTQAGKLAGSLVINLNFTLELQKIKHSYARKGQSVYITDQYGSYLLHPETRKMYGSDLGHRYRVQEDYPHMAELFLTSHKLRHITLLPSDQHSKQALVFVRVPLDDKNPDHFITIGIGKDYQSIVSAQYSVLAESSIVVFLLILFSALLAYWFADQFTNPVQAISSAVNNFSKYQDSTIALPVNRSDELGMLARNFETLFNSVKDAEQNLKQLNNTLEQTVRERTAELTRFKTTLDKTLDCVFMFEPGSLKFFYMNDGAIKQVGYSSTELLNMHAYDIKPQYDETQFRQMIEPLLSGKKEALNFQTIHQHKDGHVIPVEIFLQYINPQDEPPRFVAMVRDISERMKVDRMKNEFISTVSHELRTPLTSIRGSLGLLVGGAAGELSEQGKSLLDIAHKNTERLLLLINDILDMSKIESGKMDFHYKNFNLLEFLQQAVEANTDYGSQHHVRYEIDECPDDIVVYADQDRLLQVMNNLMSNAAKFSPAHSTVRLYARRLDNMVRVYVEDQGKGIPREFHEHIFDRFAQADSSDTRQAGGTGLGLNISRAIIQKHNGQIGFTSEEGQGSTFYFELPVRQAATSIPLAGTLDAVSEVPHGSQILICEDDQDIAHLLQLVLAQHGYQADIAHSATEARKQLASKHYQAMTLDIMLPDESGVTLFEDIRANPGTHELPIIVISAIADETRKQLNGGAIGIIDWLTKPIDQQRLIGSLDSLFNDRSKTRPRILHIEDEADVLTYVSVLFKNRADITPATTVEQARQALESEHFDLIILDIGLPDGTGFDILPDINSLEVTPPVVIFSAQDIDGDIVHQFNDVLVKARASNTDLLNTILSSLESDKS